MKRFQFPLERVRQYRLLQMETEQARLEQLHAKLHALDLMEADLARQRREAEDNLRRSTAAGAPVDPVAVGAMADFREFLNQMARNLAASRAELNHQIAVQRRELLEARRRYEVLDRFRGHARRAWIAGYDKEQEALAGENYLSRFGRA